MMSASVFPQELEQDPFDPEDFVERLAWRLSQSETPDPIELHRYFEQEIENLQALSDQCQTKINRLQNQCQEEEEEHFTTLERLQSENQNAFDEFRRLEDKINAVSTKVVHLGDQLQSADAPRARANEALQLMRYFNEFLSAPEGSTHLNSDIFNDPDMLIERAGVMSKLYQIAQELPAEQKQFKDVKDLIQQHYESTEQELIEELSKLQRSGIQQHVPRMKQVALILSQFKNYPRAVDNFIEFCQIGSFRTVDVFALFGDIKALCQKFQPVIAEVFPEPEQVLSKLVLNIFQGKLKEEVQLRLDQAIEPERYLRALADLYAKTKDLIELLKRENTVKDDDFLITLTNHLFGNYLNSYAETELKQLNDHASEILQRFYEKKNHQKKTIQGGGLQDLKRDITMRFTTESFGGETFLSEEVSISILNDTKLAFERCKLFADIQIIGGAQSSSPSENVEKVLDVLLQYLILEHLDYAVELALYGIPLAEPKTKPELYFLKVVQQVNALCHLFDKQFTDCVLPLVIGTPKQESCVSKKNMELKKIEAKLSNGLDRLLNAVTGYCRYILVSEQKKTDFRPEAEDHVIALSTTACNNVIVYLKSVKEMICDSLDGENLTMSLQELVIRFHRVVLDQIYQFTYNTSGALVLLCDVSEYKKFVDDNFKTTPIARKLFDTLRRLCNLLAISAETLKTLDTSEYEEVDRSIIANFVQLRADFKSTKLLNDFK